MSPAGRTWGVKSGQSQTPKSDDESGKREIKNRRDKQSKKQRRQENATVDNTNLVRQAQINEKEKGRRVSNSAWTKYSKAERK